jgi:hypothetical protein
MQPPYNGHLIFVFGTSEIREAVWCAICVWSFGGRILDTGYADPILSRFRASDILARRTSYVLDCDLFIDLFQKQLR